ncbi:MULTISPECIES: ABC transporter permease [unclassified Bosea (in: a-proteobacteria)]|uniref:ABC transporter permease n=1 Tax=unclassified Bosea (in: a-proteobacteria) TaxID=2653178 RepID=UPI000F75B0EE|nr:MULTISPECIES: ABC transporter permease [unclassified Bosea (in: a-proteobacteria)]AZO80334.1 ABC transporter permease [Bosea sp. Tri-49]RXT23134.1 ABC transporter permease [Bosea sp. Tri-39]RXT38605.1 ABC transporter permease [Bosea sp. Tri-54]
MSMSDAFAQSRLPLTRIIAWLAAAFLLLPLLVVIPISFTPERYLSLPTDSVSLRHYGSLVSDGRWSKSIVDSLLVGIGAMVLATLMGTAFAVGAWRLGVPLARRLRLLLLAPIIVPPIVHAIAFYRAWAALGLLDTYLGLVLVHAMKGLPFVVLTVAGTLANLDPRLEQAARSLGADARQAMSWVIFPQIRAGIVAGAAFAFITSWDETIVALFITSRAVTTLPRRIWEGLADNIDPAIAALGTVMIVLTFVAVAFTATRGASAKA